MPSNKNKHLTDVDRSIIKIGIINGSTKSDIASTLGKDKSTIGKEIAAHRSLVHPCSLPKECAAYKGCIFDRNCTNDCPDFVPFRCFRRDRSPGACNGCSKYTKCRFNKYYYDPATAQCEYRELLVSSRSGINLLRSELKEIADIVVPLIKQGQSPYVIVTNHPELRITEKTLYNYIEAGYFREFGLSDIDLRLKVKRKVPKNVTVRYKKRKDSHYLKGRTYKDFEAYMEENPNASVVEMDTVYNDGSFGPFMQTFKFRDYGFIFIVFHEAKTSDAMVEGLNMLEKILGEEIFKREVQVLLTDRGSEFSSADRFEFREENIRRTRVFYCDPMASGQKGSVENKHKELRYICPKNVNLKKLGLTCQESCNIMISHINSYQLESLKGQTPLSYMAFLASDLYQRFIEFGIQKIEKDKVVLKPYLLKNFKG